MRVVDTNTGKTIEPGDVWRNIDGTMQLVSIRPGFFRASAVLRLLEPPGPGVDITGAPVPRPPEELAAWPAGESRRVPLVVRWLHPRFFMQHVGFIPS